MKKAKKVIIIISILIVLSFGSIFAIYKIFKDKNSLTISEKTWINNNKNSLYSIAGRFGTTVSVLKNANNLKSDLLSIGQKLIIP